MANLSGHTEDLEPLYKREFTTIDRKTFDTVMKQLNVTLNLDVDDTLSEDPEAKFRVELKFEKFEDFHPTQLIKQVPRLWELYQRRQKLQAAKTMMSDPAVAELATKAVKKASAE